MNSRRTSDLSNEEFAIIAHHTPFALYQQMRSEYGQDAQHLSRLATLHSALGNQIEALDLAKLALARDNGRDPRSRIRAHLVCGTFGFMLSLDTAYRAHFIDALGEIVGAGLGGSDLHVATMINWACCQSTLRSADTALRTFDEAEHLAAALSKDWPLRKQRLRSIEVNRMALLVSPVEQADWLLHEARACERESLWSLAGTCHLNLAEILRRSDLYTAAVQHATRAAVVCEAANEPHKVRQARLCVAKVWFNLGLREQGRAILAEPPNGADLLGSSWRFLEAERLFLEGDDAARMADYEGSLAQNQQALELIRDDLVRAPGLTLNGPLLDICTGALLACGMGRLPEHRGFWLGVLDEFADQLDSPTLPMRIGDLFRGLRAFLTQEPDVARDLLASVAREGYAQRIPIPADAFHGLDGLQEELAGWFGDGSTARGDLLEYWDHVVHLVGEDDEGVRAAYRRANVLPVLHRLLSRQQMTPWEQFEAVELARWGSLTGELQAPIRDVTARASLRQAFLRDSAERRVAYPASLGRPRGLEWDSLHSSAHQGSEEGHLDLCEAIAAGDWAQEPEILQLYLRNRQLYRVQVDTASGEVVRELLPLEEETVLQLRAVTTWISPQPTQIDLDISASIGLPVTATPTIAAIRCCVGPFVDRPELASDFGLQLPAASRDGVAKHLRQLEMPSLDEAARAIGRLIPPSLHRDSDRPVLFSLSNEMAHLPISLAATAAGRFLGAQRPLAILPPLNTLAAVGYGPSNSAVENWTLMVVGNARDDLAFTTSASRLTDLRDAFMVPDGRDSQRAATLYKGHYFIPIASAPSQSGLPTGTDGEPVLSAQELLAERHKSPARVALMSCRGSGMQFPDEWGGIASALMVNGSREIIAPHWPIIDSPDARRIDDLVERILVGQGHLEVALHQSVATLIDAWLQDPDTAIPPHWWSGLSLLKA